MKNVVAIEFPIFRKTFPIKKYLDVFEISLAEFNKIFKKTTNPIFIVDDYFVIGDKLFVYHEFAELGITIRYEFKNFEKNGNDVVDFEELKILKIARVDAIEKDKNLLSSVIKEELL